MIWVLFYSHKWLTDWLLHCHFTAPWMKPCKNLYHLLIPLHQLHKGCLSVLPQPSEQRILKEEKQLTSAPELWLPRNVSSSAASFGSPISVFSCTLNCWFPTSLSKCSFLTFASILLHGCRIFWKSKTRRKSRSEETATMVGINQEKRSRRTTAASSAGKTCPTAISLSCFFWTFAAAWKALLIEGVFFN